MKLTRKSVYHLGIASQLFQKEAQADETLPIESRKININVTARMFIRKNAKEISEIFDMIKEEEKRLAENNFGYHIQSLGYTQFFEDKEHLDKFQKSEDKFVKELTSLREMALQLTNNGSKEMSVKIDADFNALRAKYIQPGNQKTAGEHLRKYNEAFKKFIDDEEGSMEFRVQAIKAKWFEDTHYLPQAFIDHYEEAGLIDYE